MPIDFETDETTEYFDHAPTTEFTPVRPCDSGDFDGWDAALLEWYRGDQDTRAESPKARRQ